MTKVDLKKELSRLYNASSKEPEMVDVPEMAFMMIDGKGDPNTAQEYQEALEALYNVSYTLKFMVKGSPGGADYVVPPLEGLWWAGDMEVFSLGRKGDWKWTAMILVPEWVTEEMFEDAVRQVKEKKDPPGLPKLRFERYHEGPSAQVMHIGPYNEEAPTIERLHAFIHESGHQRRGKHHEIYLGDPRRTAPERLKTIIRQPIE